jgi:uncharacterized protein (DUF2147 family)
MLFKLRITSFSLMAVLFFSCRPAMGAESSPVGLWKTFDDRTHKPRGTIRIYEENGSFFGKIESSFNPEEAREHCVRCSGDRKDVPIIGLVILRGMSKHGSEYDGGDILDPETGSIYRCRFLLSMDGEHLLVRGYLGLSIFGRTQTWIRLEGGSTVAQSVTNGHSIASIGAESTK